MDAGPVETATRSDIEAVVTVHPMGEALAAMAISLARTLDEGAGMAAAAVSRELRATLDDLASEVVGDDDDLDAEFCTPDLPSEVRDPEDD
jgi:hypothetical protein